MQPNRALVTKPDNLSLVPNPTRCQERTSSCRLPLASTCMDICGMCMGTRAHINRWINRKQDKGWPLASTCMYVCTQIPTWTPLGAYPPQPSHRIYILTRATLKLVRLWLEPHSRQGFRIHFFSCWIPAGSMSRVPQLLWVTSSLVGLALASFTPWAGTLVTLCIHPVWPRAFSILTLWGGCVFF